MNELVCTAFYTIFQQINYVDKTHSKTSSKMNFRRWLRFYHVPLFVYLISLHWDRLVQIQTKQNERELCRIKTEPLKSVFEPVSCKSFSQIYLPSCQHSISIWYQDLHVVNSFLSYDPPVHTHYKYYIMI